jgi:cyanobactin biosynthesis protein (PatB/AcyB/McaB family)
MTRPIGPPLVSPIQRRGAPFWPASRPAVIVDPADLVDTEHGDPTQLFDIRVEKLHGLNVNDPAKWRSAATSCPGPYCVAHTNPCGGFQFVGRLS